MTDLLVNLYSHRLDALGARVIETDGEDIYRGLLRVKPADAERA